MKAQIKKLLKQLFDKIGLNGAARSKKRPLLEKKCQEPVKDKEKKDQIEKLFDKIGLNEAERNEKRALLEKNRQEPVKIIGIGQAGVGKTELLRSIFNITKGDLKDLEHLKTGAVESVTKDFFSFSITSNEGFKVQFTDGPGLGESTDIDEQYFKMWIDEIPNHDILYWVLDGSNRDISHIQNNMKRILDATNYREKLVIILNKVDQILLDREDEAAGKIGWDYDLNMPSAEIEELIYKRTNDVIKKLEHCVAVSRDQMVVCSARRRWNHGKVFDKILNYLPSEKRIKVSINRNVKDFSELMSKEGKRELRAFQNEGK
jgi:predicted GTPase